MGENELDEQDRPLRTTRALVVTFAVGAREWAGEFQEEWSPEEARADFETYADGVLSGSAITTELFGSLANADGSAEVADSLRLEEFDVVPVLPGPAVGVDVLHRVCGVRMASEAGLMGVLRAAAWHRCPAAGAPSVAELRELLEPRPFG